MFCNDETYLINLFQSSISPSFPPVCPSLHNTYSSLEDKIVLPSLDYLLQEVIVEGLRRGVPKQTCLNMVQALQQRANEDPSAFQEPVFQVYREHADIDPQVAENIFMIIGLLLARVFQTLAKKCRQ